MEQLNNKKHDVVSLRTSLITHDIKQKNCMEGILIAPKQTQISLFLLSSYQFNDCQSSCRKYKYPFVSTPFNNAARQTIQVKNKFSIYGTVNVSLDEINISR